MTEKFGEIGSVGDATLLRDFFAAGIAESQMPCRIFHAQLIDHGGGGLLEVLAAAGVHMVQRATAELGQAMNTTLEDVFFASFA